MIAIQYLSTLTIQALRQSFKDQMNAMMAKELMNQDTDGFAALGAMLASTMVDKMIDGFVTPEGMTLMLQGKDLKQSAQQSMGGKIHQTKKRRT